MTVPGRMERAINRVILKENTSIIDNMLHRSIWSRLTTRKSSFPDKLIALR